MLSFSCGVTVHSTAAASVSDGGMPPCTISQLRNCIVNSHAKMLLSSSAFSIFCRLRTLCFILIIKVSQSFISSRVLVCFDDARHFIFLSVSCGPLPWWWMSSSVSCLFVFTVYTPEHCPLSYVNSHLRETTLKAPVHLVCRSCHVSIGRPFSFYRSKGRQA